MTVTDPTIALRQIRAAGGVILHVTDAIPPHVGWAWINSNEALVHPDRVDDLRQKLTDEPSE